jgi:hypothetical protein
MRLKQENKKHKKNVKLQNERRTAGGFGQGKEERREI